MGKFICTDQTDIFFPDRFGTPASKPPLFHLTLCLTSKVFNIEIGPFLARLISIISTILALYFISQILSLNYLGTLFLSTLFYPIVDEAFSAKVDSLNFLIIWMSLYLYSKTKWKTVLSPVFGFLLYLSKGPYSIVAFAILSFALRLESVKQIMIHTILMTLPCFVMLLMNFSTTFEIWFLFETFTRFVGSEDINPAPFYYYFLKISTYFPVNFAIFGSLLLFKNLASKTQFQNTMFWLVVIALSLSFGKRANYLLPFLPLLFPCILEVTSHSFRKVHFRKKRTIAHLSKLTNLSLLSVVTLFLVLSLANIFTNIHFVDLFISVGANQPFTTYLIFSWFYLSYCLRINHFTRLLTYISFLISFVSVGQNIVKFEKAQFDKYLAHFDRNCFNFGVLKQPRNEKLDVLIMLIADRIKNTTDISSVDCLIVDSKSKIPYDHFDVLTKNDLFSIIKKQDRS